MNIQKLFYQNILWRGLFYLTGFILNIFIARHFEASFTGQFYYLVNWLALLTLIASASMESGILYFASKNEIEASKLFGFSVVWVAIVSIVFILSFIFMPAIWPYDSDSQTFFFSMMFICGNLLMTFMGSLLYAQKNFITVNSIGIIINCILITLIFFVDKNSWLTEEKYFYFYFGSFLFYGVLLTALIIPRFNKFASFQLPLRSEIKILFKYSSVAFIGNIISFFLYRVDYWFVHKYCTAELLGDYIQVSKIAQMFFIVPSMFATVLFPLTAGGDRQQANTAVMFLSRSLFLFYGVICLVLSLTGKWFFPFIFGETFSGMYIPFLFLIPGILVFSSLYALTAYYAGKNRVLVNLTGCTIAFIFVLVADALFIPKYGITAAAAISSVGYLIYFIFVLTTFVKEYHPPLRDFFYFKLSDLKKYKTALRNIKFNG